MKIQSYTCFWRSDSSGNTHAGTCWNQIQHILNLVIIASNVLAASKGNEFVAAIRRSPKTIDKILNLDSSDFSNFISDSSDFSNFISRIISSLMRFQISVTSLSNLFFIFSYFSLVAVAVAVSVSLLSTSALNDSCSQRTCH